MSSPVIWNIGDPPTTPPTKPLVSTLSVAVTTFGIASTVPVNVCCTVVPPLGIVPLGFVAAKGVVN